MSRRSCRSCLACSQRSAPSLERACHLWVRIAVTSATALVIKTPPRAPASANHALVLPVLSPARFVNAAAIVAPGMSQPAVKGRGSDPPALPFFYAAWQIAHRLSDFIDRGERGRGRAKSLHVRTVNKPYYLLSLCQSNIVPRELDSPLGKRKVSGSDLANVLLTTAMDDWRARWTPKLADGASRLVSRSVVDSCGPAKSSE